MSIFEEQNDLLVDESVITCSVCSLNFDELDVNIIDYDLDLCITCEKKHLDSLNTHD